jgi:hypothetical protein
MQHICVCVRVCECVSVCVVCVCMCVCLHVCVCAREHMSAHNCIIVKIRVRVHHTLFLKGDFIKLGYYACWYFEGGSIW